MNEELADELRGWFRALQRCVNRVDYDAAARELFAPDVIGFGTKAHLVVGLDGLRAEQWRQVWPTIRDFRFELEGLRCGAAPSGRDAELAWAVTTWSSTGFDDRGRPFERPGRATVLFRRQGERWLALHTHFSLAPR
ncbi:MAG TPA: nuclear transport factor 2 family protein [Chloroflexota bacterium]|nr:nuclear transport factor 2 family protein [Chloroflexota bacterium]